MIIATKDAIDAAAMREWFTQPGAIIWVPPHAIRSTAVFSPAIYPPRERP